MNFFSHYFIDQHHAKQYFLFGGLLPEMLPHFNEKLRKAVFRNTQEFPKPEYEQIFNGIKRHYEIDGVFHNHAFFKRNTEIIKQRILNDNALQPLHFRTFYLAHIFLELLIDRVLIQHNKNEPEKFYQLLQQIEITVVYEYFTFIDKKEMFADFSKTFELHIRKKFLYYYTNNEMFTEALLRLYSKINTNMPTLATHAALMQVLLEIEVELQQEILIFVSEFKNQLNSQLA